MNIYAYICLVVVLFVVILKYVCGISIKFKYEYIVKEDEDTNEE